MMVTNTSDSAGAHEMVQEGGLEFDFSNWDVLPPIGRRLSSTGVGRGKHVPVWEKAAAAVCIVLLLPLFGIIAIMVKLASPKGEVLYKQERVGIERRCSTMTPPQRSKERRRRPAPGRLFWVLKFRTMLPDAEGTTGPVWAQERDPRVFPLGRVLRKMRLDELPQLINVVRGEMRLIGPRPERPFFVERLAADLPGYTNRLLVPPGITGLAQVEKNYDVSVADVETKLRYDLFYVRNRSGILDIKILMKTLDVVVRGRGSH